jgi:transcriptional regulator with XRE-family HTH domain
MEIGTKIRTLRGKMSQETLAGKLGIATRTLGSIECGETKKIDFLLMDKICKIFDVDSDYFKEDAQINRVKENIGGVVGNNNGTINNCPDNIIDQIKLILSENATLKKNNVDLKNEIISLKEIIKKNNL